MIYDVIHRTAYRYDSDVSVSQHLIRMTPREGGRQNVSQHHLELTPTGVLTPRTDYFGNRTYLVTVEGPHRRLEIVARSRVEVTGTPTVAPEGTPGWEVIRHACTQGAPFACEASEFIFSSPLIRQRPEFAEYATKYFPAGRPILEAVLALTDRIFHDLQFDPKATTATTPVEQVLQQKRGVCQDFAQFEIACLRSLGLPARYVSGYLETLPPPGMPKLIGADASHAWLQVFCGETGWCDVDPTNNLQPGERHVMVAVGRDFSDVSPVRGVLVGSGKDQLEVSVDVTPVAEPASSSYSSS